MEAECLIFESSTETANVLTSVNPGYKLTILESFEEWSKVQLPTKQKGWILNDNIEFIQKNKASSP